MCDFCERFDFATARVDVRKDNAHIELALCNTRFPKEQQFKYCPVCGANLNENKTNYDRIRNMSVKELARFLEAIQENALFNNKIMWENEWEKVLESEVEGE